MFDLIIIGAGPAGMAAGVYAARNKLKTLVLDKGAQLRPGKKVLEFFDVENLKNVFNHELTANKKYLQLQNQEVVSLEKNIVSFSLELRTGATEYGKSIIIATGQNAETLEGSTNFDLLTHKNLQGKIKVNSGMRTSIPGIFAVGDVLETSLEDDFAAAGQGATAALGAALYLKKAGSLA